MSKTHLKQISKKRDILAVSGMAHTIWREFYAAIISGDQIEYMLETFQSPAAIERAITQDGYEYFFINRVGIHAGYLAIKMHEPPNRLFISKIYLLPEYRGKGLAFDVMDQLEARCAKQNMQSIWLTVNKNSPSIKRYQSMGFGSVKTQVSDIGHGFVMDDYIMEKRVPVTLH